MCGVMGRVVSGWYFVWFGEWGGGGMFGVMCAMVAGIVNEVFRVIRCA